MGYDAEKGGMSAFEFTLVAMFVLVVFMAQVQDGNLEKFGNITTAEASFWQGSFGERKNKSYNTNSSTMNKIDSITQFLGESARDKKEKIIPALSSDQKRFYAQVQRHIKLKRQQHQFSDSDWRSILKSASITYTDIESLAAEQGMVDLSLVDWDAPETQVFFEKLGQKFGIPESSARLFAQQMPSSIGDWAFFVETQLD